MALSPKELLKDEFSSSMRQLDEPAERASVPSSSTQAVSSIRRSLRFVFFSVLSPNLGVCGVDFDVDFFFFFHCSRSFHLFYLSPAGNDPQQASRPGKQGFTWREVDPSFSQSVETYQKVSGSHPNRICPRYPFELAIFWERFLVQYLRKGVDGRLCRFSFVSYRIVCCSRPRSRPPCRRTCSSRSTLVSGALLVDSRVYSVHRINCGLHIFVPVWC